MKARQGREGERERERVEAEKSRHHLTLVKVFSIGYMHTFLVRCCFVFGSCSVPAALAREEESGFRLLFVLSELFEEHERCLNNLQKRMKYKSEREGKRKKKNKMKRKRMNRQKLQGPGDH